VDDAAGAADREERATAARRTRSVACLLADIIFPVKKWKSWLVTDDGKTDFCKADRYRPADPADAGQPTIPARRC